MIHENADIAAAERFWRDVVGVDQPRFHKPTLKPENAWTVRKNIGAGYHGCLVVGVRGSAELYGKIEGWIRGINATLPATSDAGAASFPARHPSITKDRNVSPRVTPRARQLREDAVALRLAGKSRSEIKHILGIGSNETLNEALRDVPPPTWPVQRGIRLSYSENRRLAAEGARRYWATERHRREAERETLRAAAVAEIGELTDREILVAGAVAYWCEGSKGKSYRRSEEVIFVNSDPGLIAFFLRFLGKAGIDPDRLLFRVMIHESADVAAAERFWLGVTGADPAQFRAPALKRHKPRTAHSHVGSDYHGCLTIYVRRGAGLYRRIEALMRAAVASCQAPPARRFLRSAPGGGFEPPSQQDQNLASCLIRPSGNG